MFFLIALEVINVNEFIFKDKSMPVSLIFAGLSGLGYAVAAIFSKRALQAGCGILRLSFMSAAI